MIIDKLITISDLENSLFPFSIGQLVFLKTDSDQNERIVTGLTIRENSVTYGLSCGSQESWHYDFEIQKEKDVIKQTSN